MLIPVRAEVRYQGTTIVMKKPAEFRRVDRKYGEQRTTPKVVPALSVTISPDTAIVPLKVNRQKEFTVTLENQNLEPVGAEGRLVAPVGWAVSTPSRIVNVTRQGDKGSFQLRVWVSFAAGGFFC